MISIEEFLPRVIPYATGCDDFTASRAILDTAIDFCKRTLAIEEEVTTAVDAENDVPELIFLSADMVPYYLVEAKWDGLPIGIKTIDDMNASTPDWERYGNGTPSAVITPASRPGEVRLFQKPSKAGTLKITYAMMPERNAETVSEELFNLWVDAIAAGTLERLLRMPKRNWTDMEGSAFYRNSFKEQVSSARVEVMDRMGRSDSHVQLFAFGSR